MRVFRAEYIRLCASDKIVVNSLLIIQPQTDDEIKQNFQCQFPCTVSCKEQL